MGKSQAHEQTSEEQELQLLRAVAQAWHAQTGNPKPMKEFDRSSRRGSNFKPRPTRFKLEAMNIAARQSSTPSSSSWDFSESLFDAYEIVSLSKKLEANLALDIPVSKSPGAGARAGKRARGESRNSLRSLFHKGSSKRILAFDEGRERGD